MRQYKFLQKIVLQEMKKKLHIPNSLPPLKTISNGYEYYSTTSAYGMVYLRKKLGEGRDAPEVRLKIKKPKKEHIYEQSFLNSKYC